MASLGHVALGLAAARAYVRKEGRVFDAMWCFGALAMWPDIDVVAFTFGVPYESQLGHRGATHSLAAAALAAVLSTALVKRAGSVSSFARLLAFTFVVAVSHPLLDTLTYGGGLGCALFWPFSAARFWAPVRFIPVAPIGWGVLSPHGLLVMGTELVLFAPFWLYAVWPRRTRA